MLSLRRSSTETKNIVKQFYKYPYDCRIICNDGYVEAHAVVLSTASKYLRDLITDISKTGILAPGNPLLVVLKFDRKTILSIKKLIYEGETAADADVIRCASLLQLTDNSVM